MKRSLALKSVFAEFTTGGTLGSFFGQGWPSWSQSLPVANYQNEMEFIMPFEPLRFAHAANLLVDHPLRDIGSIPITMRPTVVDASLIAFQRLIESCIDEEVDFLLISGNTFSEDDRSLRARVALRDGFACLEDAGIQVFVIPGQHDPKSAWHEVPNLPDNVVIFDPRVDEPTAIMRDGQVIATLQGCRIDQSVAGQLNDSGEGDSVRSRPVRLGVFSPGDLSQTKGDAGFVDPMIDAQHVDYLALAPPFQRFTRTSDHGLAHSPGMAISLSRAETQMQGISVVEIDEHGQFTCRHMTTSPLRREIIRLKVADGSTWDGVIAAMRQVISGLENIEAAKVLLVRWQVSGSGPVFDALHAEPSARDEVVELFGADAENNSLLVDHRFETIVDTNESPESTESESLNPITAGMIQRLDESHNLSQLVLSEAKRVIRSDSLMSRLHSVAERTDENQIRLHAKRLVRLGTSENGE